MSKLKAILFRKFSVAIILPRKQEPQVFSQREQDLIKRIALFAIEEGTATEAIIGSGIRSPLEMEILKTKLQKHLDVPTIDV